MYQDWGLEKLYERIDHEFDDEKGHAALLIERMLFLEGVPDMVTREGLKIGSDVVEMIESDLRIEYEVGNRLKEVIKICEEEQDYQSREILEKLLEDTEEDHAHWLEQQLRLIKMIGMPNYVQSQMA
jgi:bacterioferritin